MTNTYIPVDLEIGSNRTVLIPVRSDVATYFGITASTTANDPVVTRRRKTHKRNRFDGFTDTTSETEITVEASEWKAIRKVSNIGSGRKVRIPTKLLSKGNIRFTSIRFPGNATVAAISHFLYTKCDSTKRPEFFIMESGARYPVAQVTGDINPGETTTDPAPTTP